MTLSEEIALRARLEGREDPSTFDTSYIVEAGAGAGKSTTMVRRITNLLLSGKCRPEELVVITFTVKATQELRNKLEESFRKLLEQHPEKPEYRALSDSVDLIQISTIDSFCRKLLTTMPFSNPFGMSGVMDADEQKRARAYFRRRCREDEEITHMAERFALPYGALEETFLHCCGAVDYRPAYTPPGETEIRKIEQELLPAAAQVLRGKVRALWKDYPAFIGVADPELRELLALSDTAFNAGEEGLERLIRFLRTHKKLPDSLKNAYGEYALDVEAYLGMKERIEKLPDDLLACLPETLGKRTPMAAVEGNACRKRIMDILARDPLYEQLVDPELKGLLDAFTDDTFDSDPPSLKKFNDLLCEKKKAKKNWLAPFSNLKKYRDDMESALWLSETAEDDPEGIPVLIGRLIHSYVMDAVSGLLREYGEEKRAAGVATFSDVLVMARDMLRDDSRARAYFRGRYRCFYVDEFQDTDAVQTELLFYLATPEDFHVGDWRACRPRPGSLFLVGDPKQAIYRFRGADIDTYNEVWELFARGGIGKCERLSFNFRSTGEVCGLVREVFQSLLDGGAYQASYADMRAVCLNAEGEPQERESDPLSLTLCYPKGGESDPERVAAFVERMVGRGVPVSTRDGVRSARYGDFLILTCVKKQVNVYAEALRARHIPVNVSGEWRFSDTVPIAKACIFLRYLLDREDSLCLIRILRECYGTELPAMRRLMQRGGLYRLTDVFAPEAAEGVRRRKLDGIAAALSAEAPQDAELLALCGALSEIGSVAALADSLPAMSVLERMLAGLGCLWPRSGDRRARREDRARVEQFLERLRSERMRDFASLAARALELAEESVDNELALETEPDCVRVMNLHKAKGLEGEIVVLTEHAGRKRFSPTSYRERAGRQAWLHLCVAEQKEFFSKVAGWSLDWPKKQAIEAAYQSAEMTRLLYVAATRAKSMLIVNQSGFWEPIWRRLVAKSTEGYPEQVRKMARAAKSEEERNRVDALYALYTQMPFAWEELGVQRTPQPSAAEPPQAPVRVSAQEMEIALQDAVEALSASERYVISPSRLDHAARAVPRQKDRLEEDAAREAREAEDTETDARDPAGPHGPDWGTIVHRVMELAVRGGRFDRESIATFARQAVFETLDGVVLTRSQRRMLGGDEAVEAETLLARVAEAAALAADFLTDEAAPLRRLTAGGDCYPELPFHLCAADRSSEIYRHLAAHISDAEAQGKTLETQGVIDLAIRKGGTWTIVDYKTDIRRAEESVETFRERLRSEYTPQIAAYARVMELFGGEKAERMYLCSIPLGGELIELSAEGE